MCYRLSVKRVTCDGLCVVSIIENCYFRQKLFSVHICAEVSCFHLRPYVSQHKLVLPNLVNTSELGVSKNLHITHGLFLSLRCVVFDTN